MNSIRELRERLQAPRHVPGLHLPWWIEHVSRKLSIYLTFLLIRTPITANSVSLLMILAGAVGAICFLPASWPWYLGGAVLLQVSLILDCSDGEVARYRGVSSITGNYLDGLHNYVVPSFTLLCLGVGLSRASPGPWAAMGGCAALFMVWTEASYDLRFRSAYMGRRDREIMMQEPSAAAGSSGVTAAPDSPQPPSRSFSVSAIRTGLKFVFEPPAFSIIMAAAALAGALLHATAGGKAQLLPFKAALVFYLSAGPYFLLSTVLAVRYRETEKHDAALRRMFSR